MADKDYSFGTVNDALGLDNRFDYRLSARAKAVIYLETDESEQHTDRQQVRACPVWDLSASGMWLSVCAENPVVSFCPRLTFTLTPRVLESGGTEAVAMAMLKA